jgi:hypothetical protein
MSDQMVEMNQLLESIESWPTFRHYMVTTLYEDLIARLSRRYDVRRRERRYTLRATSGPHSPNIEQCEEYIEIHEGTGSLVTLLDVVSPTNKTTDTGRQAYLETWQHARDLKASLVEIDLVLQGQPTLTYSREGLPDWDYAVTVIRSDDPDRYYIYAVIPEKRLPRFGVPLSTEEPPIVVDLQGVLTRTLARQSERQIDQQCTSKAGQKNRNSSRMQDYLDQVSEQQKTSLTHDDIAIAAYYIWKEEGCPDGRADDHWYKAIERLREWRKD